MVIKTKLDCQPKPAYRTGRADLPLAGQLLVRHSLGDGGPTVLSAEAPKERRRANCLLKTFNANQ